MLDPRIISSDGRTAEDRTADGHAGPSRPPASPPRQGMPAAGWLVLVAALGAALVLIAVVVGRTARETWTQVLVDAGFALLTVGVLGLLLDAALDRVRDERPVAAGPGPEAGSGYGFAGVREQLDVVDVLRSVGTGQELWWMDTFPLTLGGDLDAVHRALGTGVRVRLLVLDPRSPSLAARLREIRHHYGLSPMDLRRAFDTLSNQLKVLGATDPAVARNLEVRAYDGLPGAPMFLVVGGGEGTREVVRAFSSYYLLDASQDMPYLEWHDGPLAVRLQAYFEHKWDGGHTVFPVEPEDRSGAVLPPRRTDAS